MPEAIRLKPGPLDEAKRRTVRQHPMCSAHLVRQVAALARWRLPAGRPESPSYDHAVELLDLCDQDNFPIGASGTECVILTA